MRTATLLLVATYTPEMSPSICVEAVEKLGQFTFCILVLYSVPDKKGVSSKKPDKVGCLTCMRQIILDKYMGKIYICATNIWETSDNLVRPICIDLLQLAFKTSLEHCFK